MEGMSIPIGSGEFVAIIVLGIIVYIVGPLLLIGGLMWLLLRVQAPRPKGDVTWYCVRCGGYQAILEPRQLPPVNGNPAVVGVCTACGSNIVSLGQGSHSSTDTGQVVHKHWSQVPNPKPEQTLDELTQWAVESVTAGAEQPLLVGRLCGAGWPRSEAVELANTLMLRAYKELRPNDEDRLEQLFRYVTRRFAEGNSPDHITGDLGDEIASKLGWKRDDAAQFVRTAEALHKATR